MIDTRLWKDLPGFDSLTNRFRFMLELTKHAWIRMEVGDIDLGAGGYEGATAETYALCRGCGIRLGLHHWVEGRGAVMYNCGVMPPQQV